MASTLLAAALVALLSGCGSDATATDPATDRPPSPTAPSSSAATLPPPAISEAPATQAPSPGRSVDSTQVAILSASAAGGQVGTGPAVALGDDEAVQAFGAQFRTPNLTDRISRVVARTDVPLGSTLYGAVVAVGCDVPAGVVVTRSAEGVVLTAQPGKKSQVQCFAAVTSVALVLVTDQEG